MSSFELFLQLPLFKGIEKDDLFSLIPKINLDFENYQPGQVVFNRQMEPKGLVYLLKGKVMIQKENQKQILSTPGLMSYTGLFGSNRNFSLDASAIDVSSTLEVDTKSLLFLLRNSPVFLINYLDILSDSIDKPYLNWSTI